MVFAGDPNQGKAKCEDHHGPIFCSFLSPQQPQPPQSPPHLPPSEAQVALLIASDIVHLYSKGVSTLHWSTTGRLKKRVMLRWFHIFKVTSFCKTVFIGRLSQGKVSPSHCPLGCSPPGGQSENKKSSMHIPPSHDPSKWILKGILIWSTGRPPPRLVFFTRSCDIKCGLWAALEL